MELSEEQNKLKEVAAGNVQAFECLFFHYQPRLLNFLTGLTHDKEISRDMAQDLFLSLWKEREKLKNIRFFSSYLFQMARFTVYDYFDRLIVSEKYTNEYLHEAFAAESEEEALFVRELQSLVNRTVEQMSPQRSKIYKMSREKGLSNEEIATRLNLSNRTVENHLTTALAILRKVIYLFLVMKL
ncbi:MAG: RNA polymerase sigma-70 factor [Parabacteroides sp.]|nr:RNA polymerase sigma-70 factor [Parabacteroides sp.]